VLKKLSVMPHNQKTIEHDLRNKGICLDRPDDKINVCKQKAFSKEAHYRTVEKLEHSSNSFIPIETYTSRYMHKYLF